MPCLVWMVVWGRHVASAIESSPSSAFLYTGRWNHSSGFSSFDAQGVEVGFRVAGAQAFSARLALVADGAVWPPRMHTFVVLVDGTFVAATEGPCATRGARCTFAVSAERAAQVVRVALPRPNASVRLVSNTEPEWARPPVSGVEMRDYVKFYGVALEGPAARFADRPRSRTRRIEFLGDSITAGFCNLCAPYESSSQRAPRGLVEAHRRSRLEDGAFGGAAWRRQSVATSEREEAFTLSWPFLICEALDAECSTTAWSGVGLTQNCCGGDVFAPELYRRTLATDPALTWDFSSWRPDALVVNLGTNDGAAAALPEYTATYLELLRNASHEYGAHLAVFLACGPMSDAYCDPVRAVVAAARADNIVDAHFLDQRPFLNGSFGEPCCGHPSAEVDAAMASDAAAFIAETLGWAPREVSSPLSQADGAPREHRDSAHSRAHPSRSPGPLDAHRQARFAT